MLVEVCANSVQSAQNGENAGADRIELCSELAVGGITPSYGLLKSIKERISIPVNVLIRPRSGDFTYSDVEFDIMKKNIALCVDLGVEGIVSGVLMKDFTLDIERTKELIAASKGLKFTFHRAFDWVKDPFETLQQLEALEVDYILSSGQQDSAPKGLDLLSRLSKKSSRCTIMPGGGVRADNIDKFKKEGFGAVHLSGVKFERSLDSIPTVSMNSSSFLRDHEIGISNQDAISAIVKGVK